jgi:iron(II)-dependent oxidoreductase
MTRPLILGQLGALQDMMRELVRRESPEQINRPAHRDLACLCWYLGRTVFRETYWLREVVSGDADLTSRVRHLFHSEVVAPAALCDQLPPPDHLLRWAAEIQDENLRRLATVGAVPSHPLLAGDRLQWFLLQAAARDYEAMLAVLHVRRLRQSPEHRVAVPLDPHPPAPNPRDVVQGHYRVGSRAEPFAYDNELPPQAVELASFRIAARPASNAEYLAFMEDGGYRDLTFWSLDGRRWLAASDATAPLHWRRDEAGRWYGIGLNGPSDLQGDDPVAGINHHEATAFAAWSASLGGELRGAVLPHEYQWEVAARSGLLEEIGKAWEWCANSFHPYPQFAPFPDQTASQDHFGGESVTLRGAGLHTQGCLRRASFRNWASAHSRHLFAGSRLVFPPA